MPLVHLLSKCEKVAGELGSLFYKQLLKTIIIKRDREDTPPPYKNGELVDPLLILYAGKGDVFLLKSHYDYDAWND
jgi:hypothetical protein